MLGVLPIRSGTCADTTSEAYTFLSCLSCIFSTISSSAGLCSARLAPPINISSCLLIPLCPAEICFSVIRVFDESSPYNFIHSFGSSGVVGFFMLPKTLLNNDKFLCVACGVPAGSVSLDGAGVVGAGAGAAGAESGSGAEGSVAGAGSAVAGAGVFTSWGSVPAAVAFPVVPSLFWFAVFPPNIPPS